MIIAEESVQTLEQKRQKFFEDYCHLFKFRKNALKQFLDTLSYYEPIGIVDIEECEPIFNSQKNDNNKHYRIIGENNITYQKHNKYVDLIERRMRIKYLCYEIYHQSSDTYSGYLLFPMKNGKFYKIIYDTY